MSTISNSMFLVQLRQEFNISSTACCLGWASKETQAPLDTKTHPWVRSYRYVKRFWYFSCLFKQLLYSVGMTAKQSRRNHSKVRLVWFFYSRGKWLASLATDESVDQYRLLTGRIKWIKGSASSFQWYISSIGRFNGLTPTLVHLIENVHVCKKSFGLVPAASSLRHTRTMTHTHTHRPSVFQLFPMQFLLMNGNSWTLHRRTSPHATHTYLELVL